MREFVMIDRATNCQLDLAGGRPAVRTCKLAVRVYYPHTCSLGWVGRRAASSKLIRSVGSQYRVHVAELVDVRGAGAEPRERNGAAWRGK